MTISEEFHIKLLVKLKKIKSGEMSLDDYIQEVELKIKPVNIKCGYGDWCYFKNEVQLTCSNTSVCRHGTQPHKG